jgi:hypothetical protein
MKEAIRTNQAKTDANQAKMDAALKEVEEEMMARLEAMIQANHEKVMVKLDAYHERMEALLDVSLESTEAYLEKIEVNQGKVEIKMEVCLEEMQGETIGTLKEQFVDQHLAVRLCCRLIYCTVPAWHKGHSRKRSP